MGDVLIAFVIVLALQAKNTILVAALTDARTTDLALSTIRPCSSNFLLFDYYLTAASADVATTDAATTDVAASDATTTDVATTDAATTDVAATYAATTIVATTDAATTNVATNDAATTDVAVTDATTTDVATTDEATTDVATTQAMTTTTLPTRRPWPKPNCGNPQLTNSMRSLFLNMHNNFRGSLARGQTEKSMGWGIAPPATLMYRMKYDCAAESFAQQHVTACNTNGLPEHTHPNHKANLHILHTVQTTPEGAIQNALSSWWSQLAKFGIRSNMMFHKSEQERGSANVLSWSKMAWWNNIYIGCSVKHCGKYYLTACMYRPGGNHVNGYVYNVGAVCSECPKDQCDGQALCRW
ncbi:SCP-like protein [Ancylostoma caninum]|uniref:SCP-like protein n=1 Tax=Ancylostoma caninum TaxID=29170 RepID=A0A368FGV5_ANCCA|nr:SCP-like protein [Ancylostoma caninum]